MKLATAVARRYLEQARESGDPRFAGLALAALRPWPDANAAPDEVLLAIETSRRSRLLSAFVEAARSVAAEDPDVLAAA